MAHLNIGDLKPDEVDSLVRILAATDSLFMPFRFGQPQRDVVADSRRYAEIVERRSRYHVAGVEIIAGGKGADRQQSSRALDALRACGWILASRWRRAVFAKLTERATDAVRLPCGCWAPHESDAWRRFKRIGELCSGPTNAGFVNEQSILARCYNDMEDSSEMVGLSLELLPFLIRGWLDSHCDVQGRLGYRLSDAGRRRLAKGKPRTPRVMPDYDERLGDLYSDLLHEELAKRTAWKGMSNHVGIPLSAGMWPENDCCEVKSRPTAGGGRTLERDEL